MADLKDVEGIGESYAAKLKEIGIGSTDALLDKGATPQGRKEIADKSGISGTLVLRWVNRADLARVKGIGGQYADLLEAAGVDTVPELGQRKPENLHQKMTELNEQKKLVRQMPTVDAVTKWVAEAKGLPRKVNY